MELISYDEDLASMAADWVKSCSWRRARDAHGVAKSPRYKRVGQNLHATATSLNVSRAMDEWYREKKHYIADKMLCHQGEHCHRYCKHWFVRCFHVC